MEKEFVNLIAHELRTSMQAILGYLELAMMDANYDQINSEKGMDYVGTAYRNALKLCQRLTKDILDVERIESNTLKLSKERFDLVEKIDDAITDIINSQTLNKLTRNNNTEIVFNNKPDTALYINADSMRIYEVISNLLNNAISATKNDGKIIVYTEIVRCTKNDNNNQARIVISIKDNGTGIDTELMTRLFTKFATKFESGLGLGLFISKSIVEAHGGRLWAENNKGKGATFAFSLYI